MKFAIFSDVHGNLEALEAVLAAAAELGADALWSLGDIVGYGHAPRECIALVRERAAVSTLGNHDAAAVGRARLEEFNELARLAVEWTAGRLTAADRSYLEGLPLVVRTAGRSSSTPPPSSRRPGITSTGRSAPPGTSRPSASGSASSGTAIARRSWRSSATGG